MQAGVEVYLLVPGNGKGTAVAVPQGSRQDLVRETVGLAHCADTHVVIDEIVPSG